MKPREYPTMESLAVAWFPLVRFLVCRLVLFGCFFYNPDFFLYYRSIFKGIDFQRIFITSCLRFFLFYCFAANSSQQTSTCVLAKLITKYFLFILRLKEKCVKINHQEGWTGTVIIYTEQGTNEIVRIQSQETKIVVKRLECYIRCLRRSAFVPTLCLHVIYGPGPFLNEVKIQEKKYLFL